MNGVKMFAIYERPKDHPDKFVVRCWIVNGGMPVPDTECRVANTLEEARKFIPEGSVRLPRELDEDKVVVETWL